MASLGFSRPVSIYVNWASYDTLSDDKPLTEKLAFDQLDHLLRLKGEGVRFDYYLMDCFWFDPDGGYRTWDARHWSKDGPFRWIDRCLSNDVQPGLWVGCNNLRNNTFRHLNPIPEWRSSLDASSRSACLFHGGFLGHLIETLQFWADQKISLFKFDFMELDAAPPSIKSACLPSEIIRRNAEEFRAALHIFRERNPTVRLIAYNGFAENGSGPPFMSETKSALRKMIDTRWLDVFDAVYCGDPRPADIPCANFWRSKDIYSDHMVRAFEANGFPLQRIDNAGFMIGTTGTCYGRGKKAWRGMLLLSLARSGWANTYYGNLDLLTGDDARWFARVQGMFTEAQQTGTCRTFGGVPGQGKPYGYWTHHENGDLCTVVNPSQSFQNVSMPVMGERILFSDFGNRPTLGGLEVLLGPEQMAVVGSGAYRSETYSLGTEPDVTIPRLITLLGDSCVTVGKGNRCTAVAKAPSIDECLRIVVRQSRDGMPVRSTGGAPPSGISLGKLIQIKARQSGREVEVKIGYDLPIWSGLSWAVGEISGASLQSTSSLEIECFTMEGQPLDLDLDVSTVTYGGAQRM